MKFSKNVNNKKHAPKLIFFNEKKNEKDLDNFWRGKLALKVRNCQFSITWFRADVDLPKIFFLWKSAIFHSIQLPFDAKVAEKILNVHHTFHEKRIPNFHEWNLIHKYSEFVLLFFVKCKLVGNIFRLTFKGN